MNLTPKERQYIIDLIIVDVNIVRFIRGFAPMTEADKKKKKFCNQLIQKLGKNNI